MQTHIREKLTEKINSIKVQPYVKEGLIEMSEDMEIQIQQVVRKILKKGVEDYMKKKYKNK